MKPAFCIAVGVACVGLYRAPMLSAQQQPAPVVTVPGAAPVANPELPSQPAVSVKEVSSPAAPAHYGDQAIWALMVSFLIQWLKKSPWFGFITPQSSAALQARFGFLAAFLTAAGIHFAITGSVLDGGGASISITGITLTGVKDVLWQWAAQQGWYRMLVKEPKEVTLVAPAALPLGSVSESTRSKL
jgi:hypothetical protein